MRIICKYTTLKKPVAAQHRSGNMHNIFYVTRCMCLCIFVLLYCDAHTSYISIHIFAEIFWFCISFVSEFHFDSAIWNKIINWSWDWEKNIYSTTMKLFFVFLQKDLNVFRIKAFYKWKQETAKDSYGKRKIFSHFSLIATQIR